ncbi:MAG: Gfo/Idh/MocA family oxidoreductase [Trueperaceae bacterium]|nr:Gfo/Idh/MocA family oxidoreductase [Trueperaceae bacterium]
MAANLRIGLVGYGVGGRVFHAPIIDAAEGCELSAILARSAERQAEAKSDYPAIPVVTRMSAMAEYVDAVVISTPLWTHAELAREALKLGLPCIIDKPFGTNAQEARAVLEEAEAKKIPLMVYQNRRWDADYLTLKKVIASGELGALWLFESRMEELSPPGGVPASGGGVLIDFGSHVFDQTLQLFGPAKTVYAEVHPIQGREPLEDRFFAIIHHESGMRSHLTGDLNLQGEASPRFRLTGTKGTFTIPPHDGMANILRSGGRKASHAPTWAKVPEEAWGKIERPGYSQIIPSENAGWTDLYEGFARAVRGEGRLPVDPWDSLKALELIDAAKESVLTHQVRSLL